MAGSWPTQAFSEHRYVDYAHVQIFDEDTTTRQIGGKQPSIESVYFLVLRSVHEHLPLKVYSV